MTSATDTPRALLPLVELPAERPTAPSRPCAACDKPLEPLRAGSAAAFDDGVRYFCSPCCLDAYRRGIRGSGAPRDAKRVARAATGVGRHAAPKLRTQDKAISAWPRAAWPSALLSIAALLSLFAEMPECAVGSALSCGAATVLSAAWSRPPSNALTRDLGHFLPAVGALLAATGACELALSAPGDRLPLWAAVFAAGVQAVRYGRMSAHEGPLDRALCALTPEGPTLAHEPVAGATDTLHMQLKQVPVSSLRTGREVVVHGGDMLAVDGVVVAGNAELLPYVGATATYTCAPGDAVLAGAQVKRGALRLAATHVGSVRRLHRFRRSIEAGVGRWATPFPRLDRRLGRIGLPVSLGLGLAAALAVSHWVAVEQSFGAALMAAAAVMLIAPLNGCRAALQQPFIAAAAHGAQRGMLFRDARALEAAGRVAEVMIRPRGVLLSAAPEVTALHPIFAEREEALLPWLAGAERAVSRSGLAQAVLRYTESRGVEPADVRRAVFQRGMGVVAMTSDKVPLLVGSRRLLLESGVSVAVADEVLRRRGNGQTAVLLALDGHVRGVLLLRETVRHGVAAAMRRLGDMELPVLLLSGDQRPGVEPLVDGFQSITIKADLTPQERIEAVLARREAGVEVAAIGMAGTDDAFLAAADVGIGLRAVDTSAGEPAVAVLSDEVGDAAAALWMARVTRTEALRCVRLSLWAFAGVCLGIACGWFGPGIAAVAALAIDELCLSAGARLLRHFALRLPAHS